MASDNDALTLQILEGPAVGSLYQNYYGQLTYYSPHWFAGPVTITYRISDGAATSDPATITINVTDTAPVATNDAYVVQHGHTLAFDPRANDSDADTENYNDTLSIQVLEGPASGYVYQDYYGALVYVSDLAFTGTVTILYQVTDGALASDPATITIDVVNEPPVAIDDVYSVHHGQVLYTFDPRSNDTNADGDALSLEILEGPAVGSLYQNYYGQLTYYSPHWFAGPVTITYRISDGAATSDPATVTINVSNSVPVAADDTGYWLLQGETLTGIDVLTNDTQDDFDPITIDIVTAPAHGALTWHAATQTYSFTAAPDYFGPDSFTYRLHDGAQYSNTATVAIDIVRLIPLAVADTYTVHQGLELDTYAEELSTLLDNDVDPEGAPLSIIDFTEPAHGRLHVFPDGHFLYLPDIGYVGEDSFNYVITDGLSIDIGTVSLNVTNETPETAADSFTNKTGQVLDTAGLGLPGLLNNDTDPDGDELMLISRLNIGPFNPDLTGMDRFTAQALDLIAASAGCVRPEQGSAAGPRALRYGFFSPPGTPVGGSRRADRQSDWSWPVGHAQTCRTPHNRLGSQTRSPAPSPA